MERIHRISSFAVVGLSLGAALLIVSATVAALLSGQPPAPGPKDEGAGAHIFQLLIVALGPATLVFLPTADWRDPLRAARPLILALIFVAIAFSTLYYFEHVLGYA